MLFSHLTSVSLPNLELLNSYQLQIKFRDYRNRPCVLWRFLNFEHTVKPLFKKIRNSKNSVIALLLTTVHLSMIISTKIFLVHLPILFLEQTIYTSTQPDKPRLANFTYLTLKLQHSGLNVSTNAVLILGISFPQQLT